MSDDLTGRFRELGVLQHGHFRLSSGAHSDTYLQLARALQHPAVALELGRELAARTEGRAPQVVASPALGGVLAGFVVAAALDVRFVFAERGADGALEFRRGQGPERGERVLVVEDVVTTGGSAASVASLAAERGAEVVGVAAIVDRSGGQLTDIDAPVALLTIDAATWPPETCPHCARGEPIDAPGSRMGPPAREQRAERPGPGPASR